MEEDLVVTTDEYRNLVILTSMPYLPATKSLEKMLQRIRGVGIPALPSDWPPLLIQGPVEVYDTFGHDDNQ